jgi:hypothetical protein
MTALAAIARLIGAAALGTCTAYKAIRQKSSLDRIEKLGDVSFGDESGCSNSRPELGAEFAVFRTVRASVIVELDIKRRKVSDMLGTHISDQIFLRASFLPRANHDRGAVSVIGTDVNSPVTAEFLKTDPDIRLHVFDEMPNVNGPIGVRQGGGYQELAA